MSRLCRFSVVCVWAVLVGVVSPGADREESLSGGVRGFSGQVRGVVVEKGTKNTFMFKVGRVLRVWDGNKAQNPGALAGRTVWVGPRWVEGDGRIWHPVERHVAFIRRVRTGQEMTLEIANAEGSHFSILELTAEQRRSLRGEGDGREREGERREGGERDREREEDRREGGEREREEGRREGGERDREREEGRREGDDRERRAERDGDAREESLERQIRLLRAELEALRRRLDERDER